MVGRRRTPRKARRTRPMRMVRLTRAVSPGDKLLPLTIKLSDDDTGSVDYQILEAAVLRNDDDDNENDKEDRFDYVITEDDDDLKEVSIASLLRPEMDPNKGDLTFFYDWSEIRVWDSPNKKRLILPSFQIGELPELDEVQKIDYSGQETIWIEGVESGAGGVYLSWIPTNWDGTWLGETGFIYGGRVEVTVWTLDLDMDSDNTCLLYTSPSPRD